MSSTSSPLLAQALNNRRSTDSKRSAENKAGGTQNKHSTVAWWGSPKLIYGTLMLVVGVLAGSLYFGSSHLSQPVTGVDAVVVPESSAVSDKPVTLSEPVKPGAINQATTEKPKVAAKEAVAVSTTAAYITIAVSPWGEVYLNGRKKGVAPPLKQLQVEPGKYTIEIRNTHFPSYKQTVEVNAQATVKVKHRFQ